MISVPVVSWGSSRPSMRRFGAREKAGGCLPARRQKGLDCRDGPGSDPCGRARPLRSRERVVVAWGMPASNLRHLSPFRVALLATLAAAIVYLPASQLGIVQQLEGELLDLRFQARPPQPTSGEIVLVLIDDASLAEVGRWPWSRSLMADLVARLEAAGAQHHGARPAARRARAAAASRPQRWRRSLQGDDALARLPELIERGRGRPPARRRGGARRQRRAADPVRAGAGRAAGRAAQDEGAAARSSRDAAFRVVQQAAALSDLAEPPAGGARAGADRRARPGRSRARPRQRAARSQRRAAARISRDPPRGRLLSLLLARDRAPASGRRSRPRPAAARPGHRPRRSLGADRREHAPADQLRPAGPLSCDLRGRRAAMARRVPPCSRARSC